MVDLKEVPLLSGAVMERNCRGLPCAAAVECNLTAIYVADPLHVGIARYPESR
jgi:hypothetical protein